MPMVELRLSLLCYATKQVNVPIQIYDLRSKNTFPGIDLTISQLPSSVEVLTNVRQGPQRAEIATVTKLYTKLQAVAEADYLKYILASFYQMAEPASKQNKIAKQHYSFISFPQLSPGCFCYSQMHWQTNTKFSY